MIWGITSIKENVNMHMKYTEQNRLPLAGKRTVVLIQTNAQLVDHISIARQYYNKAKSILYDKYSTSN